MRAARRRLSGGIVALLVLTGALLAVDAHVGRASAATVVIDPGSYTGRYFISTTGYGAEYHGQQSFDLAPGQTYWIHQGASEFYFQVAGDGQVTSLSPAATGSGNRVVFNTVPIVIDPGSYTGRYYVSTIGYGTEYHDPQTVLLMPGLRYWIHQGASEFYFQVAADGQVTSLSPAATSSGNRVVFNTVPVVIDPGSYTGRYYVSTIGYGTEFHDPQTVLLMPGLRYWVHQGASEFYFDVDATGQVTSLSPAASGTSNRLSFTTVQIVIEPASYSGRYYLSTVGYGTEFHGEQTYSVMPGLRYWVHQGADLFYFEVAVDGQVTSLSQAAQGSGNRLVFSTVSVVIDPGAYAGRYFVSSIGYGREFYGVQTFELPPALSYWVLTDTTFFSFTVDPTCTPAQISSAGFTITLRCPPAPRLIGQWSLDEGFGQTVYDGSGEARDGQLGSTPDPDSRDPSWTLGRVGPSALHFDGTTYVEIPVVAELATPRVSVGAWVRNAVSPGALAYIVSRGAGTGCGLTQYALQTGPNGGLVFQVTNQTTYFSPDAGAGVWDGAWHHVLGTYDGVNLRLYLDGMEVGSGTPGPLSIDYTASSNDRVYLGAYGGSGAAGIVGELDPPCAVKRFQGDLDEVQIWDGAVSNTDATHDTTPPTLAFQAPPSGAYVRGTVVVQAQASDSQSEVASFALTVDGRRLAASLTPAPPAGTIAGRATWNSTTVPDGAHTLGATATDRAANTATATRAVVVDNTPPTTTITGGPSGTTAATTVTFTFTGTDNLTPAANLNFAWLLDGAAFGTFSSTTSATFNGLATGAHTFEVKARDQAGNESPVVARSFTVGSAVQVAITSPANGATVPAGMLLVQGRVDASGAEVGVTVNSIPAAVQGNVFATLVPADTTITTLTATATLTNGSSATSTSTIIVSATQGGTLRATPSIGIAPLNVAFIVSGAPVGALIDFDFDGDGRVDLSTTASAPNFAYLQPGLYFPSASFTDDRGVRQTVRSIAQVYDSSGLGAVLQARWTALKDALRRGDIPQALINVVARARPQYEAMFNDLRADLPNIDNILTTFTVLELRRSEAICEMLRPNVGFVESFEIRFLIDDDGVWRLAAF